MCVSARVTCHVEVSICQREKVYPRETLRLPDCVKERLRPLCRWRARDLLGELHLGMKGPLVPR